MLGKELLGQEYLLPHYMMEDNTGCIFLIRNQTTGQRTKHMDIKLHFVRELNEREEVVPVFERSESNEADGMTKNQPEKLFSVHSARLRYGGLSCRREDVKIDSRMVTYDVNDDVE